MESATVFRWAGTACRASWPPHLPSSTGGGLGNTEPHVQLQGFFRASDSMYFSTLSERVPSEGPRMQQRLEDLSTSPRFQKLHMRGSEVQIRLAVLQGSESRSQDSSKRGEGPRTDVAGLRHERSHEYRRGTTGWRLRQPRWMRDKRRGIHGIQLQ